MIENQLIENKKILQNMLERDVGNIYVKLRDNVLSMTNKQPLMKKMAANYISANEKQWLAKLDEQIELIVEASFINPQTTLNEAIVTATDLINTAIGQFLESKLNIPMSTVQIGLQTLFGISSII